MQLRPFESRVSEMSLLREHNPSPASQPQPSYPQSRDASHLPGAAIATEITRLERCMRLRAQELNVKYSQENYPYDTY